MWARSRSTGRPILNQTLDHFLRGKGSECQQRETKSCNPLNALLRQSQKTLDFCLEFLIIALGILLISAHIANMSSFDPAVLGVTQIEALSSHNE